MPTLRVTSRLVFLDVTVLDKHGHPVVTGLTQDDFQITEDKEPQHIFSFEPPSAHTLNSRLSDGDSGAPRTILVLDLLNSRFQDFAYLRYEFRRYLDAQPRELTSPAELMVVGNDSLQMVQNYTRSRRELLDALDHIPAVLPYKEMSASFWPERIAQSVGALQQIALQNKGIPGRKNIIWLGYGMPSVNPAVAAGDIQWLLQYLHFTTNMLVDSRVSLFVIYPGLRVSATGQFSLSAMQASVDLGEGDPFGSGIDFGILVNETGGKLFYGRNDVDEEIRQSQILGSEYYTLTYQPQDGNDNGRFRRIRVTLRNRSLTALTKTGYFAPDKSARSPQQKSIDTLSEAAYSTISFKGLDLSIGNVVRQPGAQAAEFTLSLQPKNLDWMTGADGDIFANLMVAAVSLNADGGILAYRFVSAHESARSQAATRLTDWPIHIPLSVRVPRGTRTIRVVAEAEPGGRMGSADMPAK